MEWNVARMARFAGIGVEFSGPIIAGTLIGHFLDVHFHTDPWLTLVLLLSGVFLGFFRLIREVQLAQRELK